MRLRGIEFDLFEGWPIQKGATFFGGGDKRFDFGAEGVVIAANTIEPCGASISGQGKSLVKDRGDPLPPHGVMGLRPAVLVHDHIDHNIVGGQETADKRFTGQHAKA